jgi:hypothetical protein
VSATFPGTVSISAAASVNLAGTGINGAIKPDGDTATATDTLTISSNAPWNLKASSNPEKMTYDSSYTLSNYLQVNNGATPSALVDVKLAPTGTGNLFSSYQPKSYPTTTGFNAFYSQVFLATDTAGAYSTTVTWTVTQAF